MRDKRQLTGEPFTVAELGGSGPKISRPNFSLSDNGVLVFDPSGNTQSGQLSWVDRSWQTSRLTQRKWKRQQACALA